MKLALIHLSDIHLKKDPTKNPVMARAKSIAHAVLALQDDIHNFLIVVSGDTAFSGSEDEYAHATELFREIVRPLSDRSRGGRPLVVLIPGNHDCNFAKEESSRKLLLDKLQPSELTDDSPIRIGLQVQVDYITFAHALPHHLQEARVVALTDWHYCATEMFAGHSITLHLLNSAWCSRLRERQGELIFPIKTWEPLVRVPADSELVLSVIHHPYNWLRADNARELRAALDKRSDVILTGHEHDAVSFSKFTSTGERNEYLEGGVLQDSDDDNASTFNAVVIDTDTGTQSHTLFKWNGDLYSIVHSSPDRPFHRNTQRLTTAFPFSPAFHAWLEDPGAGFEHPRKSQLTLSDLYIYPDLREIAHDEAAEDAALIRGDDTVATIIKHEHVLIIGSDTSGKTALAKKLCGDLRTRGLVPLFIDGGDCDGLNPSHIGKGLRKFVAHQFGDRNAERFDQLPKTQKALLVDDYHLLNLNEHGKSAFLDYALERFQIVVVLAGDESRFEELIRERDDRAALIQLKHLEILELGFRLRSRLIRMWHSIGREYTATRVDVDNKVSRTESQINALLGEQFMPAHPLFVLIALQQLEVQDNIVDSAGSIGHLYEFLINRSLLASITPETNADTNENYLSEFAWHFFSEGIVRLSEEEARQWHKSYCSTYRVKCDFERQLRALVRAELLDEHAGVISFKYPYLFFYFTAMYLAHHIDEEDIQDRIKVLTTYLHQPDTANIVLFLCHLSKNPVILRSVMQTADNLFVNYAPCDLEAHVKTLNDFEVDGHSAPILTLDDQDPEQRRQKSLEESDKESQRRRNRNELSQLAIRNEMSACDLKLLNEQLQLNGALKTIQIIGQILRNHVGSLRGDVKRELVSKCYALGLRAAGCLFDVLKDNMSDLVDAIVEALERKQGAVAKPGAERPKTKATLRVQVSQSVWGTLNLGAFAIIKYIAESVGTEKLSETFEEVLKHDRSMPLEMIDVAIKLDHYNAFPENETLRLAGKLQRNLFAYTILRALVWSRFYLYHCDYRVRQRIAEKLGLSKKAQKNVTSRMFAKGGRVSSHPPPKRLN